MNHAFLSHRTATILVAVLLIPLAAMVVLAFYLPSAGKVDVSGFAEIFTANRLSEILKIAQRALWVSALSVVASFVISHTLVYRTSNAFQSVFFLLITLPLLANESVRVFSWQYVLAENGLLNRLLSAVVQSPVALFNGANSANIYFVMCITCIPFGIFINSASLKTIPLIYHRVAQDLNLNSLSRFLTITLPLSRFALGASFLVMFFISFSLSTEINFLGGDTKICMRNLVSSLMSASRFQAVFALGVLILTVLLLFGLIYRWGNTYKQRSHHA